jgi:hypothetical protein
MMARMDGGISGQDGERRPAGRAGNTANPVRRPTVPWIRPAFSVGGHNRAGAMTATLRKYLDHFNSRHRQVAEQTVAALGEDRALLFVSLQSDWVDLIGAVPKAYPELTAPPASDDAPPAEGSLLLIDLQGLLLELDRQQFAFLGGHYAAVGRSLRYVWELMYRAFLADTYAEIGDGDDLPGPTPDDKAEWLRTRKGPLNRKTVIEPMLDRLLPATQHGRIASDFIPLWERLNRVVHPSWELRDRLINPSALLVADGYDADWASEVLSDAANVFDLIWLAVLHRFPDCRRLLANETTFAHCPLARHLVSPDGRSVGSE